jgi:hypothetical protein
MSIYVARSGPRCYGTCMKTNRTTHLGQSSAEAEQYVRSCGEDEGPETYEEAAEVFAALYGRDPDDDDGDTGDVWSLCCAAVQ